MLGLRYSGLVGMALVLFETAAFNRSATSPQTSSFVWLYYDAFPIQN